VSVSGQAPDFSHWEHRLSMQPVNVHQDCPGRRRGTTWVSEILLLPNFQYHRFEEAPLPWSAHGGAQQSVILYRFSVPASFRQGQIYHVCVELLVSWLTGSHPFCSKVISRLGAAAPWKAALHVCT